MLREAQDLLVLSVGGDLPPSRQATLLAAGRAALGASGVVSLAGPSTTAPPDGPGWMAFTQGAHLVGGRRLGSSELPELLTSSDGAGLARLAPPFSGAARDASGGWTFATDSAGLAHVYWAQGSGWSVASTSAAALAQLTGAGLDETALGVFAVSGSYLGDATPFRGVRKLQAGMRCRLVGGRAQVERYAPVVVPRTRYPDLTTAVTHGSRAISAAVGDALAGYPDPTIELSGGLDSRLLLAAIPVHEREGMRAVTVGDPEAEDCVLAREISRRCRLDHTWIDLGKIAELDPSEAHSLALGAARRRDYGANALAGAVLDWVEGQLEQCPRLSGQNGEFGRGFYYALQREGGEVTARRIDRLARWRVFANDRVEPLLFDPAFAADAETRALEAVRGVFTAGGPEGRAEWLPETDEFYLAARMQRWLGPGYTVGARDRVILAPFFHPEYLDWVRRTRPADRRRSRAVAGVLDRLDPELGALPLDCRPPPSVLAKPPMVSAARDARSVVSKTAGKVRQRIRLRPRAPVGAARLADLVARWWADDPAALEPVAALSFLDADAVMAIARGDRPATPTTIAFLVTLEGVTSERAWSRGSV
ncbi:MAG: hypothetical protein ACRDZO_19760, partial [Egibacteraceae bacterium]